MDLGLWISRRSPTATNGLRTSRPSAMRSGTRPVPASVPDVGAVPCPNQNGGSARSRLPSTHLAEGPAGAIGVVGEIAYHTNPVIQSRVGRTPQKAHRGARQADTRRKQSLSPKTDQDRMCKINQLGYVAPEATARENGEIRNVTARVADRYSPTVSFSKARCPSAFVSSTGDAEARMGRRSWKLRITASPNQSAV